MAEPTQFMLSHKELVTAIVKQAGVHDGRWWLVVNFAFGTGNFGPSEEQVSPGVAVGIQAVGIQRETPEARSPAGLVIDAAEVNPAPRPARSKSKSD